MFNELEPHELERLALLSEECGEVVAIIGKILRHGYPSCHPDNLNGPDNREMLIQEIGDVFAVVSLMIAEVDFTYRDIDIAKEIKLEKLNQYLHYNEVELNAPAREVE